MLTACGPPAAAARKTPAPNPVLRAPAKQHQVRAVVQSWLHPLRQNHLLPSQTGSNCAKVSKLYLVSCTTAYMQRDIALAQFDPVRKCACSVLYLCALLENVPPRRCSAHAVHLPAVLHVDIEVILTLPYIFCTENC